MNFYIKKPLLLFLASLFCFFADAQTKVEKLDALFVAAQKAGNFNGVVLVADSSGVILNKGYGWRDAGKKLKHDENSIFQIGSVTKQFTATVILRLQEQGKLSVNDKISKYFPTYKHAGRITIRNLLTHTSGIFNYTNDSLFIFTKSGQPLNEQGLWNMIGDRELLFVPGSRFSYTNSGYMLLGYIIEKITGKKYEKVVRETIFKPSGMTHSGFDYRNLASPNKSVGYEAIDSASSRLAKQVDSSVSFSAGAIYTTTGDLYSWNKALLSKKLITGSSLTEAFTPFRDKFGYGWGIDSLFGKQVIAHGGGIFGFVSEMAWIPADKVCVILLCNAELAVAPFRNSVLAILYNPQKPFTKDKQAIEVDSAILKQYTGDYQLAPGFIITVTLENARLRGQATGQPAFDLYAESQTRFFLKVVEASVDFVKDADGPVKRLVLHQNGRDLPGEKIR